MVKYTIKELLMKHLGHVKIDDALSKALYRNRIRFVNKNKDHIEFFGGVLTGANRIRHTRSDLDSVMVDIFKVKPKDIRAEYKYTPGIVISRKVSSDVLNLALMFMIHRTLNANISEKLREDILESLGLLFFLRCTAALVNAWFTYLTTTEIAEAAYERLSGRFILKKQGTWYRYMEYRTDHLLDKKVSIHRDKLKVFKYDEVIIYAINNSQQSIRDTLKEIYPIILEVIKDNASIRGISGVSTLGDGEDTLREITSGIATDIDYIQTIIGSPSDLIKVDLVSVILSLLPTVHPSDADNCLFWMTKNAFSERRAGILRFFELTLTYSYHIVNERNKENNPNGDTGLSLISLKGAITSSRSSSPKLAELRESGEEIAFQATGRENSKRLAGMRTFMLLYIFLRSVVGKG